MASILREDILHRKNKEASSKEKVDKIMSTIVKLPVQSNLPKSESKESKTTSETVKPAESIARQYIFSSEILIEGESVSELDDLRNRIVKELIPSSEIESIIVDRIISSLWRLKRCLKIESQIIEFESSCIQEYEQGFFRTRKRTNKELSQLKALKITEGKNKLEELSKYETILERQIYKALSVLDKLRQHGSISEKRVPRKTK
ncbi:MAG: hypothetical protein A2545_03610 [Planctomycetes bacterium RIFOXYD2_FULL_41_16]|nr:MAG: hypothetical protein A2069_01295 [Planctomycetes bacterium GWB2_41_19]OHB46486.1 MAG: hypothetical protein A2094_03850 [Planctomycetes bacterium GWE2_41_14]OHC05939.1 MAG: hypothetical protein A3J92_04550 [Planctomycetes bacterium RIFOXYC2_FULL_41_27]OHC07456.1 MAG: hypothetical protein A2545_03610 [Planctomycetes bacterium RIFOXYD2_FULL_41_16]